MDSKVFRKSIRELKKNIWYRRHDKFPHLIEISQVDLLLDILQKKTLNAEEAK